MLHQKVCHIILFPKIYY